MRRVLACFIALGGGTFAATTALADALVVHSIDPAPAANGRWYQKSTNGGTAEIVDLSGAGGNLETGQPKPTGAVRVTTTSNNNDRAELGLSDGNWGTAEDILNGEIQLGYSYYKTDLANDNASAAPALKLSFFNGAVQGDGFVTLIYEPYWNQATPGLAINPPADVWQTVSIDFDSGVFWQTGGFGQANSAGGPPFNTLEGWLAAFDSDFQDATLVEITLGVGSFNQNQLDYFDDVALNFTGYSNSFDFEVPEPGALALMIGGLAGVLGLRRRKSG